MEFQSTTAGVCSKLFPAFLACDFPPCCLASRLVGRGETRAGWTQAPDVPAQLPQNTHPVLEHATDMLDLVVHRRAWVCVLHPHRLRFDVLRYPSHMVGFCGGGQRRTQGLRPCAELRVVSAGAEGGGGEGRDVV